MTSIEGLTVDGLTLLNAPNHNFRVEGIVGARIRWLNVSAPYLSPNTDGVNFYGGWDQLMVCDCYVSAMCLLCDWRLGPVDGM